MLNFYPKVVVLSISRRYTIVLGNRDDAKRFYISVPQTAKWQYSIVCWSLVFISILDYCLIKRDVIFFLDIVLSWNVNFEVVQTQEKSTIFKFSFKKVLKRSNSVYDNRYPQVSLYFFSWLPIAQHFRAFEKNKTKQKHASL